MGIDIKDILKGIYMLLILFCYLGSFVFWSFIMLLISEFFEKRHNNTISEIKELKEK